jgi:hypothetical protein
MVTPSLYRSDDRSKLSSLNNYFFKIVNILFLELLNFEFQKQEFPLNFYIDRIIISKIKKGYAMFIGVLFFFNSQIQGG